MLNVRVAFDQTNDTLILPTKCLGFHLITFKVRRPEDFTDTHRPKWISIRTQAASGIISTSSVTGRVVTVGHDGKRRE